MIHDMAISPDNEVLKRFGVRVIAPLGGRLNQHWLVESRHTRLVLRRWVPDWVASMDYELSLLARLAGLGWPVAHGVAEPLEWEGHTWSLAVYLSGKPLSLERPLVEQRECGRLMARLHADLARLHEFGQRGSWRRCEEILVDPALDHVLSKHERDHFEEVRILRWHLERARNRVAGLALQDWPGMVIHGDFTPWNLHFNNGKLSGILDFELAHWDHRVGDFSLAWRGKYDEVIRGYDEVSPLSPQEWELITPLWWSFLIEQSCQSLQNGDGADEWNIKKLLQRSPLMGPDSAEFR